MPWASPGREAAGTALQPPELEVVDHRTWVFMGDGCLMEGVA
jgi:transketolase